VSDDGDTLPLSEAERLAAGRASEKSDRPTILLDQGDVPRWTDEAEKALLVAPPQLFQRSGMIVRPRIEQVPASGGGTTTSFRLPAVTVPHIRECMMRVANFKKYDGRAGGYVITNCPREIAEAYLARAGGWQLPPIAGVITAPLLRADGSLLDRPGYDPATALLFEPCGVRFPQVSASATRQDALDAAKVLKSLFQDHPLTSGADLSVVLSGVLTALERRALPTAPLHAYTSPAAGSGKSHVVDITSMIAVGQAASVVPEAPKPDETEKRLAAALIAGDAIITLDNCEQPVGGGLLCVATSQSMIKVRVLGLSLNVEIPSNSALFATGNNLLIGSDMARRTLLGVLDPQQERPELREFASDPLETVKRDRGRYVGAALTILRAFHNSGRPVIASPIGSFVEWSLLVRNALLWLGEADPVETMEKARGSDLALKALVAVMDTWQAIPTLIERRKSARELIGVACEEEALTASAGVKFRYPDFRDALIAVAGEGSAGINARRLGQWLLKIQGRICGGRRIVQDGGRAGVAYWKLEPVEAP
jgi:putative DNA primase/helicase